MITQKTQFIRTGHTIKNLDSDEVTTYYNPAKKQEVSINAAKRESRKLQGSQLGLGKVQLG